MALFNDSFVYNYSLKPEVIRTLNSPQNRHERQRICKSICTNGVSLVGEVVAVVRKVYTEKKVCLVQADSAIILSTILQRFCHSIIENKIDSLLTNDIRHTIFLWKDPTYVGVEERVNVLFSLCF